MAPIAIVFGGLLTLLGGGFFVALGLVFSRATALIPPGFGVILIGLGLIARSERWRMHAMHVAALLGLAGAVMPIVMLFVGGFAPGSKLYENTAMAGLCAIFLALCVKSFINARRAR